MPEEDAVTPAPEDDTGAVVTADDRLLPEDPVLREVIEPLDDVEYVVSSRQDVVLVPKERLADVAAAFKGAGFEMLADLTAVDYLGRKRVRYEVVVNLLSVSHGRRIRLRAEVPAGADEPDDPPTVPSLVTLYPGANFFEREVYDMFGIVFEGHPDMTRILMPDDWVGHPLRKDFSTGAVPVQFKEANKVT